MPFCRSLYSGGQRESGWGNIPFRRRESKFQVSILCKRVRARKKALHASMTSALAPTGSMAPEDAPEAPESALNLGHASKSNFGPELIGLADEENVRLTKRPTVRNKACSRRL